MENILVTLVCITMLIVGVVTIASDSFNSIDRLIYAWKDEESLINNMRNTAITSVSSNVTSEGNRVEIVVKNDGQTDLANFKRWDVLVRYQDGSAQWLPYTTDTPGWTVGGIFLSGKPEIYEPNIFNPMETMKLVLNLSSPVSENTTNLASISTPNGVNTEITFGH
jgi:hypothetical protein